MNTQPPPIEGAWSALYSNISMSCLGYYVVKDSKCHHLKRLRDSDYRALLTAVFAFLARAQTKLFRAHLKGKLCYRGCAVKYSASLLIFSGKRMFEVA